MNSIPHVVILGGGFGGLAAANKLRDSLDSSHLKITLIDKKDWFMVGFTKLWIINGTRTFDNSIADINKISKKGINFIKDKIDDITFDSKTVKTKSQNIPYDFLIIALGTKLMPGKIPGLEEYGMNLYDHEQLVEIKQKIESMTSGKLAISIMDMPYKCPPAPYEASLLINSMLHKIGVRKSIAIDIYSPAPVTLPTAGPDVSKQILEMITAQNITFHGSCKIKVVDKNKLIFTDGQHFDFDLLLAIPPHTVPEVIYKCGLAEYGSFIRINRDCTTIHDNVYAVGDVTTLSVDLTTTVPKAGVFAEGQGELVAQNIIAKILLNGKNLLYNGQGSCFLESGKNTASLIKVDMFGQPKPITQITESTKQNFVSKLEFEKERLTKWF